MSRTHKVLPSKSNALRMPVPVITHTCLPSVTGEGVDMFCLRILVLPAPSGCFHRTVPRTRSTHHRNRFDLSATFRNTRSFQTIGVEPDQSGMASFHAMFSVVDQRSGRPVSPLTPFNEGPRH